MRDHSGSRDGGDDLVAVQRAYAGKLTAVAALDRELARLQDEDRRRRDDAIGAPSREVRRVRSRRAD